MKSRFATLFVLISFLSSCSYQEIMDEKMFVDSPDVISEFHASFSETEAGVDSLETRTYIEEDSQSSRLNLYWNEDDRISVFCGNTLNQQYRFDGETGDNSGTFKLIAADENVSYNPLDTPTNIAYYPYDENTEISEDGALVVNFPETQYYSENSFGPGANAMVAVTENPDDLDLKFKNVGGYLRFRFYYRYTTQSIKTVTLKGNNGEKLAGKASLTCAYGEEPVIEMTNDATDAVTIDCGDGIQIGIWHDVSEVEIWFVLPPVKFTQGFTITLTDLYGKTFTKTTEKTFEIKRNTIKPISTIEIPELKHDEELLAKERAALIDFYNSTGGENWRRNDNWCSDKPVREWYGVNAAHGIVETIRLPGNNLVGEIPESIGDFKYIKSIYLRENNLTGDIPETIGNLTALKSLFLGDNLLTGDIPESICNLRNLEILDFGKLYISNPNNNSFSGNIPKNIGNLKKLKEFILPGSQLTGSIPESIGKLANLTTLRLENNQLSGSIPESIGCLANLTYLNLRDNQLSGSIPESIGELHSLETLVLMGNQLNSIPESLANLPSLTFLNLKGNQFSTIPASLQSSNVWKDFWWMVLPGNPYLNKDELIIPGPDFNLVDIYGETISSENEYSKNKLTVLYLWATWCGYSKDFNKTLKTLYEEYSDKGFEIIGQAHGNISTSYVENEGILWKNFNNNYTTDNLIFKGDTTFPSVIVVDNNKKVVFDSYTQNRSNLVSFVQNYFASSSEDDMYTSTDYSRDGEVVILQQATLGRGVDLTFLGEGFVDKDMESGGHYEQKMREAMEKLFSMEPYKSMRNRFNVYAVKVVSPNAEFINPNAKHRINDDRGVCFEYAQKILPYSNNNAPMVTVVYNVDYEYGRSHCTSYYADESFIAFIKEGISNVILHETGGHGIAELLDEYVEKGNENSSLPYEERIALDNIWSQYGRGANVDWRNDASTVKWAHFLSDERYSNEGLGLYEGSVLYGRGAYRPSENSMMRYSDSPFNAPSREQIYKRVMQLSEGPDWVYDYEEFVAFDAPNRTAASAPATKSASVESRNEHMRNHQPPTIIEGSWRDELKRR